MKHTLHRGTVFVDGFGHRGTRFFPVVVAVPPGTVAGLVVALRRPRLALAALAAAVGAGTAVARRQRRPWREALGFGALVPPFTVVYTAGIWRGIALALRGRA
jgi:hypothetical protein